jgi:hypothetical protein
MAVVIIAYPLRYRRDIGSQIMQNLQARLTGFLYVTLTAMSDVQPFYEKLGWRKMTTRMIFPRDEEQARRNCE